MGRDYLSHTLYELTTRIGHTDENNNYIPGEECAGRFDNILKNKKSLKFHMYRILKGYS